MASFGTHEEPIFYAHKYWAYYVLPVLTIYFGIGVIWLIYRILTAHNDEFIVTNKKCTFLMEFSQRNPMSFH